MAAGRARRRRPEHQQPAPRRPTASIVAPPKDYYGIRLGPYKYIEWPDGEKELYDLNKDPYELNNRVRDPNFFPIRDFLHRELLTPRDLRRPTCQEAAGEIPLTRDQQRKVQARTARKARTRTRTARKSSRNAKQQKG